MSAFKHMLKYYLEWYHVQLKHKTTQFKTAMKSRMANLSFLVHLLTFNHQSPHINNKNSFLRLSVWQEQSHHKIIPVHILVMLHGCLDLCRNASGRALYASEWPSNRSSSPLWSQLLACCTSRGPLSTRAPSANTAIEDIRLHPSPVLPPGESLSVDAPPGLPLPGQIQTLETVFSNSKLHLMLRDAA